MSDRNTTRWSPRVQPLMLAVIVLLLPARFTAQNPTRGPEELRGKVAGVRGDRVQITFDQPQWLPRAGSAVSLGAEMAGMFVPLKGNFVIVHVDVDAAFAMAIGKDEHGTPAAGMLAVVKTSFPAHPLSRADYVSSREQEAAVMPMADGGNPQAQHLVAMGCRDRGDHDGALAWWERASTGSSDRVIVARSASGRASILAIRGAYRQALAVLQDAATRTAPRDDERVFGAYSALTGAMQSAAVEAHVSVLTDLGDFHRQWLGDIEGSRRWFRQATAVMASAATNGAPQPGQQTYPAYLLLVRRLANTCLYALEDADAAVPWLRIAAAAGDGSARAELERLGRR